VSDYLLEDEARAALAPCAKCDLKVPHAFVEPDAHTWDPDHMTVDPRDVLMLIEALRKCEEGPWA